jgi:hypothetical protein
VLCTRRSCFYTKTRVIRLFSTDAPSKIPCTIHVTFVFSVNYLRSSVDAATAFRELVRAHFRAQNTDECDIFMGAGFSKRGIVHHQTDRQPASFTSPRNFRLTWLPTSRSNQYVDTAWLLPTLRRHCTDQIQSVCTNFSMQLGVSRAFVRATWTSASIRYTTDEIKAIVQKRFESISETPDLLR